MEKKQERPLTVVKKQDELIIPQQSLLQTLMYAVTEKNLPVESLEKFIDLAVQQQKREAEQAFHRAFAAFKADPPKIVKDRLVDYKSKSGGTSFKHASIGNVVNAIIEGMSKHGLSHNWILSQDGVKVTVTCKLTHEMGHSETTSLSAGADTSGSKNSIQAIASTVTYLERYTLQAITGIAVLDTDNDGADHIDPKDDHVAEVKGNNGKAKDQEHLDQWLDWVDKYTDSTLDRWISDWEQYGLPVMKKMKPEHAKELSIVAKEMEKHLLEKEEKK